MLDVVQGEKNPEVLPDKVSVAETLSEKISEKIAEKISESIVEKIPDVIADKLPAINNPNPVDIAEIAAQATIEASQKTEEGVKEAAQTTAKATKQAAWINGISGVVVSLVVAGSATGGTYLYFEPLKEDLKQTKEQLQNFQACFYSSEKYRAFEAKMVKKAEELFVSKSADQKAVDAYFAYKAAQETHLVNAINNIPNKMAYDKVKENFER